MIPSFILGKKNVIIDTGQLTIKYMKLNQFFQSSTHIYPVVIYFILYPLWLLLLLHLICVSTCIIVIYSFLYYKNKGEERENRFTLYSCFYHYCLLIQDQSVIVRRSVHSFNSITLLSLSSCCRCHSHTAYATIFNCCVHKWTTCTKYVYLMRKYLMN